MTLWLLLLACWTAEVDHPTIQAPTDGRVSLEIVMPSTSEQTWQGQLVVHGGDLQDLVGLWTRPTDKVDRSGFSIDVHKLGVRLKSPNPGLWASLSHVDDATTFEVSTPSGPLQVRVGDLLLGVRHEAGGLFITRHPAAEPLSSPARGEVHDEEDFPAAATAPDGTVHVVYSAFSPDPEWDAAQRTEFPRAGFELYTRPTRGDQIWLRSGLPGSWGPPEAVTPAGRQVWQPRVAVAGDGSLWVFWSEYRDGDWEIVGRRRAESWGPEQVLTRQGTDIGVAAATARDGSVWITWQGFTPTGDSHILVAHATGDRLAAPEILPGPAARRWSPSLAASPTTNELAVAWDVYDGGDYDVRLSRRVGGSWTMPAPIAATDAYEARPTLAYDARGRLWASWEQAGAGWGKDYGEGLRGSQTPLFMGRTISAAVWSDGAWQQPAGGLTHVIVDPDDQDKNELSRLRPSPRAAYPQLHRDRAGRMWLSYRAPERRQRTSLGGSWNQQVTQHTGTRWTLPVRLTRSDHYLTPRSAWLDLPGDEVGMVVASDHRRTTLRRRADSFVDLYINTIGSALVESGSPAPAPPPIAPHNTHDWQAEAKDVLTIREHRVRVAGRSYRIVRGDSHRHTEISFDGTLDGSVFDCWRYALDAAQLDWIACTDHYRAATRAGSWWQVQKATSMFQFGERFRSIAGYERSQPWPAGHRNVLLPRLGLRPLPGFPDDDYPEPHPEGWSDAETLFAYARQFGAVAIAHTSASDMGTDWTHMDSVAQPLVEIYQGARESSEHVGAPRTLGSRAGFGSHPEGMVSEALKKGHKLGFVASSDHTSTHISYAMLLSEDLSTESLFEAMRARRTYAATDNIVLEVRSGDTLMGGVVKEREPALSVRVIGTGTIARLVIVRDGTPLHTEVIDEVDVSWTWTDPDPQPGEHSYYVRVEQEDGELAWSSPIWFDR